MSISHICWRNALKGLAVAIPLLVVSGFFVFTGQVFAVDSAVIISANPNTVNSLFTPEIGLTLPRGSEAYLGRTTTYTGPDTFPADGNSIQWRVTIDGPVALTADMVDFDEVGFKDDPNPESSIGTYHYPSSVVDGNLVANGSCVDAGDHVCNIGTDAFSLDENDIFTNADKIKFNSNAPLGSYTISYKLVNTNSNVVLSNAYEVSVDLVVKIFIDANEDGVFNDGVETDYLSIQDAIGAATAGDTIQVAAGTYEEKIVIGKPVILKGPNFGISPNTGVRVAEAIITGTDVADPIIEMTSGDLTGFTIDGFTISGVTTIGQQQVIHLITDGDNIAIRNNRFLDNSGRIFVSTPPGGPREGLVITNNLIDGMTQDNQAGMQLFTMNNCQITDNVVKNTTYGGIQLGSATNCTISGNTVENVPRSGIAVDNSTDIVIENNTVSNAGNDQTNDDITENGGITIYNPDQINITITNNTLSGNFNGVAVRNDAGQALGSGITANFNNRISGSVNRGTDNAASSGTLNAANNWWGNASGPNHANNPDATGDAVSDNITYLPWCSSAECASTLGGLTLSSTEPTILTKVGGGIENAFTPEQGLIVNSDSDVYLGLNAVSSLDMPVYNIVWKFVIDGPGSVALVPSMVEVQEVGWFDQDECGIIGSVISTCPNTAGDSYTFAVEGSNLVAYGSGGTFDSDPIDEFVTVSRIHFNPNAPLGEYKITATIVGENVTVDDPADGDISDPTNTVNISNGITKNFALVPSAVSTVVTEAVPADTPTEVDASSTLNVRLNVDASSSIQIAVAPTAQPASAPGTTLALSKFLAMTTDDESSIESVEIRVYYTDAEVETAGIIESELRLWFYDENALQWTLVSDSGVNTSENYVHATVDHLSTWGVFGARVVTAGGGGGGGGGGAPAATTPAPAVAAAAAPTPILTPPAGEVLGAATFRFAQTLRFGSTGDAVTELQNRLTSEGVYTGPITGYFGPLTERGVKAFQEKYGIEQVGIVGPLTRAKLNTLGETAVAPAGQVLGAVTAMTPAELQAKIAEIQAQINVLLQQVTEALQQLGR